MGNGPAPSVIAKFGGIAALARKLGHENASTVQGWKERGFIPVRHHVALLDLAHREGVDLTAGQLSGVERITVAEQPERAA